MKILPFRGLKTGVLAILVILIVSAMILVDVVMIKVAEADLISARIREGTLLLRLIPASIRINAEDHASLYAKGNIENALQLAGFSEVLIRSADTEAEKTIGTWGSAIQEARSDALKAILTKSITQRFYGSRWGVVWFSPERLIMSAPISTSALKSGSVTIGCDLGLIYESLNGRQIPFLIFLALYASILVLIGMYLFSRVIVAPVRRLLSMAADIDDLRPYGSHAGETANEIDQLFVAVNEILSRLEENKTRLKDHIASLEKANQEIEKARDEMVRSEKLAAAGRLAAGFAHEIGNPLGIVTGYFEILRQGGLSEAERLDLLERAGAEIGRMSKIIRQMLNIARPASPIMELISVHAIISETIEFLAGQPWLSQVEIKPCLEAAVDSVWGDPEQLREVFLNIIMNSADALDGKGTIRIKTMQRDETLRIEIADTGPGIPQPLLSEIFDPFFTTKEPGKGTGLGLWVCYRIITSMRGRIEASGSASGGACIVIELKAARVESSASDQGRGPAVIACAPPIENGDSSWRALEGRAAK